MEDTEYKIHPFAWLAILAFVVLVAALLWMNKGVGTSRLIGTAQYLCAQEKTIRASYYEGSVTLTLNDGRVRTLSQTEVASGARYANDDESFIFLSRGNTATVLEKGVETHSNCVTAAELPSGETGGDTVTYANPLSYYSIAYPKTYSVTQSYMYTGLGPGKEIKGIKFTIPPSMSEGTNLSSDSGISVEEISNPSSCTAERFMLAPQNIRTVNENGIEYSVADQGGAGAGNFYEERVYVVVGSSPCVAVRYFIHSTNVGNYEPGTVREFDRAALLQEFDTIRNSLNIVLSH